MSPQLALPELRHTYSLPTWHHVSFSLPPRWGSAWAPWRGTCVPGREVVSAHSLPPGRTFAANRRPGEGGRVGERRETEGPMCPQLPSLNLMGPELLLGGQAEQEVQGLREWTLLALKNPCSPASQVPRLQNEGNYSAPDSQMGRTHKSSALSVLPDTPPNREFCAVCKRAACTPP